MIPLSVTSLSQPLSPHHYMQHFQSKDDVFLLESATSEKTLGRYSIIGFNPKAKFIFDHGHIQFEFFRKKTKKKKIKKSFKRCRKKN